MKNILFYVALISLVSVFSCGDSSSSSNLVSSNGGVNEIIVVIPGYTYDSTAVGEMVKTHFRQDYKGLLMSEPSFRLIQIDENAFGSLFQVNKSILIVDIDENHQKSGIGIKEDMWARNQLVVTVKARSEEDFRMLMEPQIDRLVEKFRQWEVSFQSRLFVKTMNTSYYNDLKDQMDVLLCIPGHYRYAMEEEDFAWFRNQGTCTMGSSIHGVPNPYCELSLLVQSYDYTSKDVFTAEGFHALRDSLTKAYVPGGMEGSYMKVAEEFVIKTEAMEINGHYAMEFRGRWRMENATMGGPFLSYMVLDERNNKVFLLDGFVYAPANTKGKYLTELEGIINTVDFISREEDTASK